MSRRLHLSHVFVLLLVLGVHVGAEEDGRSVYVVYMGAGHPAASPGSLEQEHLHLLASVVSGTQAEKALVRSYRHGFSGFAARLSEEEAVAVSKKPGVVSVFIDPVLQLLTTRSWDFLRLQNSVETDSRPFSDTASAAGGAADTIIGMLDTGVWPESESFDDRGMVDIPVRWKGKCEEAPDFKASNCNRKLIGARSYGDPTAQPTASLLAQSPRDTIGHGTHTASTAAGSPVLGASYYGLASGIAKGGSTTSRLAIYKVCTSSGCRGSAILAGFDDAIADGVDVLSLSLGASAYSHPDFSTDPIAIGSFHAVAKGILVVCSAGNSGPTPGTVVNAAPWILTVAATTIDRNFESDVVLGGSNSSAIKGEAINFSNLSKSAIYPLISGQSAESKSKSKDDSARNCDPYALDADKVKGKIVLCEHPQNAILPKKTKVGGLKSFGASGVILIDDEDKGVASNYLSFPATVVSAQGGAEIFSYIKSTENPVATILPSIAVNKYKPAPAVAYFSSRGPSGQTRNILKPDVSAPGVNILAAWPPSNDSSAVPPGEKPTSFNLISGTSMSCPHVSGIAAAIKSWNPTWSPSAIRSAVMTTGLIDIFRAQRDSYLFMFSAEEEKIKKANPEEQRPRRDHAGLGRRGHALRLRSRGGEPDWSTATGPRVRNRHPGLPPLPLQLWLQHDHHQAHLPVPARLRVPQQREHRGHLRPQLPIDRRVGLPREGEQDGEPDADERGGGGGDSVHSERGVPGGADGEGDARQASVHEEQQEDGVPGHLLFHCFVGGGAGGRFLRFHHLEQRQVQSEEPVCSQHRASNKRRERERERELSKSQN